jgi:hypothetical protein
MNLKLNIQEINIRLSKAHFKCKFILNDAKNQIFWQKHVSMKLLEVSLSCLHFSLIFSNGEVMIKFPYIFASVVGPS